MAKKVYKLNNNKVNKKSELNSKADSVLLTGFRKIEEDAFVKENMTEDAFVEKVKLNNKVNKKSELNSKADSVLLTGFKKIEEDAFVEEVKENKNQFSDCCYFLRKIQKSLNLVIDSFKNKFQELTAKNSKLGKEISFLNADIETLIDEKKQWDKNIERVIEVIEEQRKSWNMYEKLIETEKEEIAKINQLEIKSKEESEEESEEEITRL